MQINDLNKQKPNVSSKKFLEQMIDGILVLEYPSGVIKNANDSIFFFLGIPRSAIIGKNFWELSVFAKHINIHELYKQFLQKKLIAMKNVILSLEAKNDMVVNIYGELHTFECHDPLIFLGFENKSYVNFLQNKLKQLHLNEDNLLNEKFHFLINTAIAIDSQNAKHQLNVSKLAVEIAKELNLDTLAIHRIMMSSLVHDIGKISIPKEILNKSTALRIDEILLIKNHVQASYDILIRLLLPLDIAKVVLQHHERLDGSGYPHRLFKSEICQEAKILMVADTVESMRHSRPYRPDFNLDRSLQQLEVDQYSKLPSDIVNVCTNLFRSKKFSFEHSLH
ncbi:hypothetical protein PHIN8_05810 [Polynucleobacter sp. HIN8]|uniref:HD-GYP domain-containing protein n=1 Tax=Polynucleobacter sp. HIN8 TaxID=3047867 RepID=UPI00257373FC|nr:HD domain-containing phosphohydrolase [Polynucleobacter sp. HIN8]BEI38637.1 hypothetical protein PHIN8_05810 [Polynucleobacter sp. HIN8]